MSGWTLLKNGVPSEGVAALMLLTDGTVLAQGAADSTGGVSNTWYRLTPDSTGSYANGTWTQLASMHQTRLYYYSGVLDDGRVFVAGGEYGTGTSKGEIYNPLTNAWTTVPNDPQGDIGDVPGKILPDGRVIIGNRNNTDIRIYNPSTNKWSLAASNSNGNTSSEVSWTLLPDGTILAPEVATTSANKYVISSNQWVSAGTVPVMLGSSGYEIGPHVLLEDGRVFCIGATTHTALYTPPSNPTDPGTWAAGPDNPSGLVSDDTSAALLTNGNVLFVGDHDNYNGPSAFFIYNTAKNTTAKIAAPSVFSSDSAYYFRMLELPNGQILTDDDFGGHVAVYTPAGLPKAIWKPKITSITNNGDGTYTLNGTQLNGRSEGAYYGDDAAMSSNYPILELVSATDGSVHYARTYNFSTMALGTGTTPVSATFTLPSGLASGSYSAFAIANGIASAAFSFTVPAPTPGPAPAGAAVDSGGGGGGAAPTPSGLSVMLATSGTSTGGQGSGGTVHAIVSQSGLVLGGATETVVTGPSSTGSPTSPLVGDVLGDAAQAGAVLAGQTQATVTSQLHTSAAVDEAFADGDWLGTLDS
jgi:hypothetical protein